MSRDTDELRSRPETQGRLCERALDHTVALAKPRTGAWWSIVACNPDAEVHLVDVLDLLEDAAEAAGVPQSDMAEASSGWSPEAEIDLLRSAMAAIPNQDEPWEVWNRFGMCPCSGPQQALRRAWRSGWCGRVGEVGFEASGGRL
jgi:hypothetical protein